LGFIGGLIILVGVLLGVAFVTLCERKVLGYVQIRKGPNKVRVAGILQPISDAVKLFTKEIVVLEVSNYFVYYGCAGVGLFLILIIWYTIPWAGELWEFSFGLVLFMCVLSVGVYSLLGAGWSSNSKYSLLGGLRSVAQTISYEVSFALIIICLVFLIGGYNFLSFKELNLGFCLFLPLFFCWFISLLAELNRTPFDFAEGERELVSGFNVEYSGAGFAIIFMAEYGIILLLSVVTVILFFGWGGLFGWAVATSIAVLIIGVRGRYPRYRYDILIMLAWKGILPVILFYFLLFGGVILIF